MIKILLVEDDLGLSNSVFDFLDDFADVMQVFDGEEGLYEAESGVYDLILLDLMLPEKNGFQVLKELREKGITTPVLIMTAKESLDDKGHGFELGADDYLTKPYATKELIARIRSTLRRHEEPKIVADPSFNIGDLAIYPDRHEVRVGDEVVDLTKKEFDLLLFLAKNKNRVLKREEVLEKVWGYGYAGKTNIVDVYVRYLRSKIDEKVGKKYIHTVRGIGYVARD